MPASAKVLHLRVHGRVLEHLGIQMYQSPVNAIAELIANAWDADGEKVEVRLPVSISDKAKIIIKDDGIGMTFDECESRYLNVGWNRRGKNPDEHSVIKRRPILGRKGIGKFAGFGIADVIRVETISEDTGERTVFELALQELMGEQYIGGGKPIKVTEYDPPDNARKEQHGTIVTLGQLKVKRAQSPESFAKSMARRFLLHQRQADFKIFVNEISLPESFDLTDIEYVFPRDYREGKKPAVVIEVDENGWGEETIAKDKKIRWRVMFHKETINEEELRGVAIFAKGKLAQRPFLFNLTGGLGGQHGVEYLSGQVEADYIDMLPEDMVSTERQRINWEHDETLPLLSWGQKRVKELLKIWHDLRAEERTRKLEQKLSGFTGRLKKLQPHESRTVEKALRKLAQIDTLNADQYEDMGDAVLTAWEQGRLRDLIDSIAEAETLSNEELLKILLEAQVLTALNTAEAVKTKILTIGGLAVRLQKKELETAVRDYIAKDPWLISPIWETFRVEQSVKKLLESAAITAGLIDEKWKGRVDLALSSGNHLLILEFMRTGLKLDWDHISRFEKYVLTLKVNIEANTAGRFKTVTGYIVADGLEKDPVINRKIPEMEKDGMYALDWNTLFTNALAAWKEFLQILVSRAPEDERLQALIDEL